MAETSPLDDAAGLWATFADQVGGLADLVLPGAVDDELHAAEGIRYLLRYLAAGITTCVEFDDATHPELGSLIENRRSWGLDNPDTKYAFTRLEPGASYTVHGEAGTALELELQVDSGHFADGRFTEWEALARWRRGAGDLPAAGRLRTEDELELTFTAPPGASYLHVREYFGDWEAERPALLTVQRAGAPLPPASLSLDALSSRMELLGLWLTAGSSCWADLGRGLASGEPGPITPFVPPVTATGLGGQAYGMGPYRCGPDDAVILELQPPMCRYWSVSLATWFWESADIANRQCSMNHTQAHVGPDGMARLVIAQRDPGVANWLDPASYERGTLALRLLDADTLPTMQQRTVHIGSLREELPPDTPLVTSAQRRALLERRRNAVVRRYRR